VRRSAALTFLATLALCGVARADGDPILPLSQVTPGMRCTGYSVIRGTDVSSFDVEIEDVVSGDPAARPPRLLVKVSGPAVDATGIGPGFSGSPIYCTGDDGVARNAGAISESLGDYGNKVALATPIEAVLGEPVAPPADTRYRPALVRAARPIAEPLSLTGFSPSVAGVVGPAAASSTTHPPRRSAASRRRRCVPARRWPSAWPAATSRRARSGPSRTSMATGSGRSGTRRTPSAGATCCSRAPTSTRS
jgi:hypothetical protein